jgi:Holliday junction resolvasome RuvABC endonuclease subunit
MEHSGMIWVPDGWTKGRRFTYMLNALKWLINEVKPDLIRTEAFFVSFKLRVGTSVIPTVNHLIEMATYQLGLDIPVEEVSPSSWRKVIGIKPTIVNGKKDFKLPTKLKVEELLNQQLPPTVPSNINGKERNTPSDIADAMAIFLATGLALNVKYLISAPSLCYNKYYNQLRELVNDDQIKSYKTIKTES